MWAESDIETCLDTLHASPTYNIHNLDTVFPYHRIEPSL